MSAVLLATDWITVSSLATAGATLVLAIATFASVRSANRTALAAERSMLAGIRPVLMPSNADDADLKVGFFDDKWFRVQGSGAVAEVGDEAIYLAASLRNMGAGIAVLHGWYLHTDRATGAEHVPIEEYRRLTRDLYIAPNQTGFWQGAFRDPAAPEFAEARVAIEARQRMSLEILYGDHEGGQRTITLFGLIPLEDGRWMITVARHWSIDRPGPR
jgi:hypothetical protein